MGEKEIYIGYRQKKKICLEGNTSINKEKIVVEGDKCTNWEKKIHWQEIFLATNRETFIWEGTKCR